MKMIFYGSIVPFLEAVIFPVQSIAASLYYISCTMALTSLETTVCLLGVEVGEDSSPAAGICALGFSANHVTITLL